MHSQPFVKTPSVSKYPDVHEVIVHMLALQANPVAFGCDIAAQLMPQPPQCARVFVVFVSQPFASTPSQLPKFALQDAIMQLPPPHVAVAFVREHEVPHEAQCESVLSGCSQPLPSAMSQSP
jgi:hypothetical protein